LGTVKFIDGQNATVVWDGRKGSDTIAVDFIEPAGAMTAEGKP
jgi:hypothetical protein